MIADELSIDFKNTATDPMGYEGVQGKLRCTRDQIELQFDQDDRAFREIPVVVREIPYSQVESVEYVSRWFRPKLLIFKTRSPEFLDGFPGGEVGKVTLQVSSQSRKNARRLATLIEYKQSEAHLDESTQRLDQIRGDRDAARGDRDAARDEAVDAGEDAPEDSATKTEKPD